LRGFAALARARGRGLYSAASGPQEQAARELREGMPDDHREPGAQELEDLARRYVDLWQDQMTALAADPDFAESLQKVMAAMGVAASGLPAMLSAWPAAVAGMMAAARPETQAAAQKGESRGESAGGSPNGSGGSAAPRSGASPGVSPGASRVAPGAAAAAAAPDGGGPDLGGLQERLAALEQRVRELEGGTGRARRSAKAKPQRN
jgi:hypothetical protein